jgi:hypothetical protein
MAMTTANLRAALERPPSWRPDLQPGYEPPRRSTPYYPPPPLGALTRLDPMAKLMLCAVVVTPMVLLAILLS